MVFPIFLLLLILGNDPSAAYASDDSVEQKLGGTYAPMDSEFVSLPAYCFAKFKGGPTNKHNPKVAKWFDIMGPDFANVHHYCMGLNFVNRAERGTGLEKDLYGQAILNFRYMITHAINPRFVLMPEILHNMGLALNRLGKTSEAIEYLAKSIEMKPHYEPPYLELSWVFQSTGELEQAIGILRKGMASIPESTSIRSRLQSLEKGK